MKLPILLAVVCCMLTAVGSAQARMQAGMWENTVKSNGQTVTRSHCVTAADADGANGPVSVIRANVEKAAAKGGACDLLVLMGRLVGPRPNALASTIGRGGNLRSPGSKAQ